MHLTPFKAIIQSSLMHLIFEAIIIKTDIGFHQNQLKYSAFSILQEIARESNRIQQSQKVSGLQSTANLYRDPYVGYFLHTAEHQFPCTFPVGGNPTNTIMRTWSMSNRCLATMHFPLIAIACVGQK